MRGRLITDDEIEALATHERAQRLWPGLTHTQWRKKRDTVNRRHRQAGLEAPFAPVDEPAATVTVLDHATAPVNRGLLLPDTDKRLGEFSWREANTRMRAMQTLSERANYGQDTAKIVFDTDEPICLVAISDLHWGSWCSDYDAIERLTDELLSTPGLYAGLIGDLEQMAIVMRSALEVSDNLLPPELQHRYTESWLAEIAPKILFSTWGNHDVMREEKGSGASMYADIMKRRVIWHSNIGHPDITVGNQTYKMAVSHRFRGSSIDNPCHGGMRYLRREGIDREIAIAGDSHVPGLIKYTDGNLTRVVLNCGTTQQSGYGKRHFSLTAHEVFPCIELHPTRHQATPYWSVREWLSARGRS